MLPLLPSSHDTSVVLAPYPFFYAFLHVIHGPCSVVYLFLSSFSQFPPRSRRHSGVASPLRHRNTLVFLLCGFFMPDVLSRWRATTEAVNTPCSIGLSCSREVRAFRIGEGLVEESGVTILPSVAQQAVGRLPGLPTRSSSCRVACERRKKASNAVERGREARERFLPLPSLPVHIPVFSEGRRRNGATGPSSTLYERRRGEYRRPGDDDS